MRISQMPVKPSVSGNEFVPIYDVNDPVQSNRNKKLTISQLIGSKGSKFYFSNGVPANSTGKVDDVALNLANRTFYQKNSSNLWEVKGTLNQPNSLVSSINGKTPDVNGNVTLTIADITSLQSELDSLQQDINDFITALAAATGAGLVGFDVAETYPIGTAGYALKNVLSTVQGS